MESLYELTEQYAAVRDMLFDEDVDEQVINDTLESIEGAIEVKAAWIYHSRWDRQWIEIPLLLQRR